MPRKFEMKNLKISFLKFEIKKLVISPKGIGKNLNEEIIYFIYATEIKLSIIPLYHLCIPPYTTGAWWYTINLNHQILSYSSISNSGMRICKKLR
jgi:hypothetical protein